MTQPHADFAEYYSHLARISLLGRLYKRWCTSPVLYGLARGFGPRVLEVGSGTGSGVLGAYRKQVSGLDINPHSVAYCQAQGMQAQLIADDGSFPNADGAFDACILDNVLEHIEDPRGTLDECHRVTGARGGLVIAVPGLRGYASDPDHKKFYGEDALARLDPRWRMKRQFALPLLVRSEFLSGKVRQYCLVASYEKVADGR